MSLWVESPNKYKGRIAPLSWVVWHSTESGEKNGAAYGIAHNWFALPSSQVSAHVVVDNGLDSRYPDGIVECVKPGDTAWHCKNGNARGYGVELVGYAAQSHAQWEDPYSQQSIRNACTWLRTHPLLRGIPARWITDAEMRAGTPGHTTHLQVSRVLGGTNHTDPGPNFLKDFVMQQMTLGNAPAPVPTRNDVPLSYGMMNNANVRAVQDWFRRMFPSYAGTLPTPATGNYLDMTVAVVKEFQRRAGVTGPDADGRIIGPRTYAAMRQYGW